MNCEIIETWNILIAENVEKHERKKMITSLNRDKGLVCKILMIF